VWTSYGKSAPIEKGMSLEVRESFGGLFLENTASLLDIVRMGKDKKQVGAVSDSKLISEAVLLVPYYEKEDSRFPKQSSRFMDYKYVIPVDRGEVNQQKRNMRLNDYAVSEEIRETSISKMIEGLEKYNVPYPLDFIKNGNNPFAMYFVEVEHELDQQDLSDIWQGLLPRIGINHEDIEEELSHEIDNHNFFGNFPSVPEDLQFLIFKVKKKAEKNYYKITRNEEDDDISVPEHAGSNWPYDHFSLVESAKLDFGIEFSEPDEPQITAPPLGGSPGNLTNNPPSTNTTGINIGNIIIPTEYVGSPVSSYNLLNQNNSNPLTNMLGSFSVPYSGLFPWQSPSGKVD
jgi:hypothetical protein